MRFVLCFLFLFFLVGPVSILAVIVDDTDPRIRYTPANSWVFYTYNTAPEFSWVDDPRVNNRTLHHSNCTLVGDCHVRFTFTGIGITVYNVIRSTVNISMSIDQGPRTSYVFEDRLECLNTDPARYTQACYNRTTYHVESLNYGEHTLDIVMLGGTTGHFDYADYFLDYMNVNDMNPNSTDLQGTSSRTQGSPSTAFSLNLLAAVLGSVVGGIVLLSAFLLIILKKCCRRKPGTYFDLEKYHASVTPFSSAGSYSKDASTVSFSTTNSFASRGHAKSKSDLERPATSYPPPQVRRTVSAASRISSAQPGFGSDVKVKPTAMAGVMNQMSQEAGPSTSTGAITADDSDTRSPRVIAKDAPPIYVP